MTAVETPTPLAGRVPRRAREWGREQAIDRRLASPTYGQPLWGTIVWVRTKSSKVYHLADKAHGGHTLCGRAYATEHGTGGLPNDAGRFPCVHCARVRRRHYL